jgi:hypothetical protein
MRHRPLPLGLLATLAFAAPMCVPAREELDLPPPGPLPLPRPRLALPFDALVDVPPHRAPSPLADRIDPKLRCACGHDHPMKSLTPWDVAPCCPDDRCRCRRFKTPRGTL